MTTASEEKKREEEVSPDPGAETLRREARTRASSLTPSSSIALQVVTDSAQGLRRVITSAGAFFDRSDSLADSQPHTFRQARAWHHRCAGEFNALLLRWPRLAFGYLHMAVVKPALNLAEWVTESPVRCVIALGVYLILRHWG